VALRNFGLLPQDRVLNAMRLLTREVMPAGAGAAGGIKRWITLHWIASSLTLLAMTFTSSQ
jgi:hypothetical protein